MDVSVFIANKKVFWCWIFLPLVLRFVLVSVVFGVTSGPLARYSQETAYQSVAEDLLVAQVENQNLLNEYNVTSGDESAYDEFYRVFGIWGAKPGVKLNADVAKDEKFTNKQVNRYVVDVSGEFPSVYDVTGFLADAMADSHQVLLEASIERRSSGSRKQEAMTSSDEGVQFSCKMEKLAGGTK
jgi:hypothetical protein